MGGRSRVEGRHVYFVTTMSNAQRIILDVAIVLGLVAVALFAPHPRNLAIWTAIYDAGHAPLFGCIALVVLRIVSHRTRGLAAYGVAFAVSVAIGALLEAVQFVGPRDADPLDFLRDVVGAASFLMLARAFERARRAPGPATRGPTLLAVGAVLLWMAVALPVVRVAVAMLQRDAAFPLLHDFESSWGRRFASLNDAELQLTTPPESWPREASALREASVARIDFKPSTYSGLTLGEPASDWSGYEYLAFETYSELDSTLTLIVRIDDLHAEQNYHDRFNRGIPIHPGLSRVRIPLADVQAGPRDRALDLSQVRLVVLFVHRPEAPFSLYVDAIRLE